MPMPMPPVFLRSLVGLVCTLVGLNVLRRILFIFLNVTFILPLIVFLLIRILAVFLLAVFLFIQILAAFLTFSFQFLVFSIDVLFRVLLSFVQTFLFLVGGVYRFLVRRILLSFVQTINVSSSAESVLLVGGIYRFLVRRVLLSFGGVYRFLVRVSAHLQCA